MAFDHPNLMSSELKTTLTPLDSITVSVVIPFHNRFDALLEAVASVQSQSHPNLEIILVDDGSTQPLDPINALIKSDSRILLHQQKNQGPAVARNLGIAKATGKYIAFLDSDDIFSPKKIQLQLAFMEANNLAYSHTTYKTFSNAADLVALRTLQEPEESSNTSITNMYPQIMRMCTFATPTVMALKSIFSQFRFPEHLKIGEDICLWIDISSQYPIGFLQEALTFVRISENSHAIHPLKATEGNLNIALYLICNPRHSQYKEPIAQLLSETAFALVGKDPNNTTITPPDIDLPSGKPDHNVQPVISAYQSIKYRIRNSLKNVLGSR